jgi:hypothetical protein
MRKTILEQQTNPCGDPRTIVEAQSLGYSNTEPTDFNLSKYCFKVIAGKKWYKAKDGSPINTGTTQNTTNIFVGSYRADKYFNDFNITEESGILYWNTKFGKTILTKKTDNSYTGRLIGQDYEVKFDIEGGNVKGGKFIYSFGGVITEINFIKIDGNTPPPSDDEGWTWREIPKAAWEALKKAGKWVKEEGGKFWAYVNAEGAARDAEENIWGCINKYNENWGYYKLLRGGTGSGPDYFYEFSTYKIDGKKTIFVYFEDGKFVLRSFDTNQDIPGQSGKWSCLEGGGYKLDYDDGRKAVFGMNEKESKIQSSTDQQNNQQSNQPIAACKSIISCPSFVDYVNKNLEYKICMKCPEIQKIQNNPVLKVIYFRKLKENNIPEKTDEIFGPIMKSAIEEYQEMNGIRKTGSINHDTFIALENDSTGRGS